MTDVRQANETQRKACMICQKEFPADMANCPTDGIALTVLEIPRDPMVGTLFCDRFQITEVLGGGGMGMVYRAKHLMMQRSVAIKILHTKMVGNADALKRFKVEAQAAGTFSHPNILNVHDFGVSNQGQPYMVMDFLEGVNLTTLLDAEKHVAVPRAVNMFLQMSSALAHAHSKDVIHRDVKPSNIMLVTFDGRQDFVKLVDFGIAKVLNHSIADAENLTRTGEVFGSPLYMSPEQCKGMKLDARADIYSLGAVMYRVVCGKPIFFTTDALETMFKQVSEMPAPFSKACPELAIPPSLEAVIFKCLAKEPDDRYQSMNELREALAIIAHEIHGQKGSINTLQLGENKGAYHSAADDWLQDLSENTGAMPAVVPAFLNTPVGDHTKTVITTGSNPPNLMGTTVISGTNPSQNTIARTLQEPILSPIPAPPAVTVSPGADNAPAGDVNAKCELTISITIDKKSATMGGAAIAAVAAVAGFLIFRLAAPSTPPATAPAVGAPSKVQSGSAVKAPGSKANTGSAESSIPPIATVPLSPPKADKKPVAGKKKSAKHKPYQNSRAQNYASTSYHSMNSQRRLPYATSGAQPDLPYPTIGSTKPVADVPARPAEPVFQYSPPPVSQPSYSSGNSGSEYSSSRYSSRTTSLSDTAKAVGGVGRLLKRGFRDIKGVIKSF